jgi:hypothetical protein
MADVGDLVGDSYRRKHPRQQQVARLAARQHGVVAHWQLVLIGVPPHVIQHWLRTGRLHPVHIGVYAVGHRAISGHGRWMAGVLACGPDAVLSHQSAAALLELRRTSSGGVHVTAPGRSRRGPRAITLHRVRVLHPDDVMVRDRIPVTSVPRTLLDLAEVLPPRGLVRAIEEAERRRLFDLGAVDALARRSPGRHGLRPLLAALEQVGDDPPHANSDFERDFPAFCLEHGLPVPELNATVAGFVVDALWRDRMLVIELDGYSFHRSRSAFEADRERDAALQLAGYRVVRITWRRLSRDPAGVARTIRALLARGVPGVAAGT